MKRIIILSERLPFPPTSGTKNLLFNYCRILHDCLGIEVINISFLENEKDVPKSPDFISKVYTLPNPSNREKLKNIIIHTIIKREYPLQVSLFWDPRIKQKIESIVRHEKPDYVIADFVRTTEYLKDFKGFKVADLQDLLSMRYQGQLKVDLKTVNPYGAYLYRLPKAAQALLKASAVKKFVMMMEVNLLRKYELRIGRQYDRVMFVAKKECEQFDKMLGYKKGLNVPLGVDYEFFSEHVVEVKERNSIAFMGALNVAHNENGIIHFIESVLPEITKRVPDAKLYIIGGGASEGLIKYAAKHIIFTGRVSDVRRAIASCRVFICPLQFGSGIKTKNIEAMAMGMPVVTTQVGAENIDAKNGADWYVAVNDGDFADKVVTLLKNPELAETMGISAQEFIRSNFTWTPAREAFESIF